MFFKKIKEDHINMFYRQMAAMTASGMSVAEAIGAIAEEGDSSRMGKLISLMNGEISQGKTAGEVLKESLEQLADIPSALFNEEREKIAPLFDRIADYGEKKVKMKSYAKTAMIYPAFLLTISTFVCTFLLLFVIPIFASMFSDMGGTLPLPTQVIINLSALFQAYWYVPFTIIVVTIIYFRRNKVMFFRIADKIPLLGRMNRKVALAEFLSNLSLLFGFQLSAEDTCRAAAGNISNHYFEDNIKRMAGGLSDYSGLINELEKSSFLPKIIAKTLKVGDKSRSLEIALDRSAIFCERDAEKTSDRFTAVLVPLTIIVIGSVLGFFILSMYLPIFSMASNI